MKTLLSSAFLLLLLFSCTPKPIETIHEEATEISPHNSAIDATSSTATPEMELLAFAGEKPVVIDPVVARGRGRDGDFDFGVVGLMTNLSRRYTLEKIIAGPK